MNPYRPTARQELALDLFLKLLRAADAVSVTIGQRLQRAGITHSQFAVLDALYHLGPLCLSELAAKILKTGGNLTTVVRNLRTRSLVQRLPTGQDRRFVRIEITIPGAQVYEELFPQHVRRIAKVMSCLSENDQRKLAALCRKLGKCAPEILGEYD
jgi:MarR family transcriptional regulator, 2-MHQ and catechol-resistance regulon repressor